MGAGRGVGPLGWQAERLGLNQRSQNVSLQLVRRCEKICHQLNRNNNIKERTCSWGLGFVYLISFPPKWVA